MTPANGGPPSLDERLEAIRQSLELASVNIHALQDSMRLHKEEQQRYEAQQRRLDARERSARIAVLAAMGGAIDAYVASLAANDPEDETPPETGEGSE